jgi:hypothetical protein
MLLQWSACSKFDMLLLLLLLLFVYTCASPGVHQYGGV